MVKKIIFLLVVLLSSVFVSQTTTAQIDENYCSNTDIMCRDARKYYDFVKEYVFSSVIIQERFYFQTQHAFRLDGNSRNPIENNPFKLCLNRDYSDFFNDVSKPSDLAHYVQLYNNFIIDYLELCYDEIASREIALENIELQKDYLERLTNYCLPLMEDRPVFCDSLADEYLFYYFNNKDLSRYFALAKNYPKKSLFDYCFNDLVIVGEEQTRLAFNERTSRSPEKLNIFNTFENYCSRERVMPIFTIELDHSGQGRCFGFCSVEYERLSAFFHLVHLLGFENFEENFNFDNYYENIISKNYENFLKSCSGLSAVSNAGSMDIDDYLRPSKEKHFEILVDNYEASCYSQSISSLYYLQDFNKNYLDLNNKLGRIFFQDGRYEEAIERFIEALILLNWIASNENSIDVNIYVYYLSESIKNLLYSYYLNGDCADFLYVESLPALSKLNFDIDTYNRLDEMKEDCQKKFSVKGQENIFAETTASRVDYFRKTQEDTFINSFNDSKINVVILNAKDLSENEFYKKIDSLKNFLKEKTVPFEVFNELTLDDSRIVFSTIYLESDELICESESQSNNVCDCSYKMDPFFKRESTRYFSTTSYGSGFFNFKDDYVGGEVGGDVFVILTSNGCRSLAIPFEGAIVSTAGVEYYASDYEELNVSLDYFWEYIFIHELGHLIFNLPDEYDTVGSSLTGWFPSCAKDYQTGISWWGGFAGNYSHLASNLEPKQQEWYEMLVGNIDLYDSCSVGKYKPTFHSMMDRGTVYIMQQLPVFFGHINDLYMRNFLDQVTEIKDVSEE